MAEPFTLHVQDDYDDAAFAAVEAPLVAFNTLRAGEDRHLKLAILIKDAQTGDSLGGLIGDSFYDWLFVKLLFVPAQLRGYGLGQRLLAQAEDIARGRGCTGIWLDTFEFQARGFYEKLGFTLFGTLPDHPKGQSRYFLQKRLD